ncbi:MAG TPA: SUMF1/EgtB/PvdO family nonheme iron enzyme [Pyrinomonadaceae bacterium]|nr:SUMF1/EgtB/PvdO family nonheme iron enzyme [Pyrinomonadaceae bacterium]
MLSPNTILQNRYRIIRELGHGGMGTVYEAIDERVNCLVALKTTRAASAREAELLANLLHPALPKVTDYFSDNDGYFLVMEYIPGDDLAKLLEIRGRPFSESEVLQWADKLLDVLQYLHGKQLFHRDIKPSNLKLTEEGGLFLLDFGLAKGAVGQMPTLTSDKSVHGYTLQFASLEQILKQGTDARSDLYSLGATLYHLITGVVPIDAHTRSALIKQTDPLPPIPKINTVVSPQVASVIHRAMAIEPDKRPTSAREMREALRKAGAARPPVPPISTIPAPHPKPHYWNSRIFTDDQDGRPNPVVPTPIDPKPVDPVVIPNPPGPSIAKVLLITFGVILLLVGASMAAVVLKTGWVPWSDRNVYDDGQTESATKTTNANTAPVVVTSPSPDQPTVQTPSAVSTVRNQFGIELVWIPPGSFMMGSNNGRPDERPVHRVSIGQGFYMSKYELTWAQWLAVTGNSPGSPDNYKGNEDKPIFWLTWHEAQEVISRLNSLNDGYLYRMPTEAEWEYACRAGTTSEYYASNVDDIAWYTKNSGSSYQRVGGKQPNAFGLYDMAGNTQEWCEDWHLPNYSGAPTDGSAWMAGDEKGLRRVLRGGSYHSAPIHIRCASRSWGSQNYNLETGVRLVAVAVQAGR